MKKIGNTLILEPEDVIIYLPDVFWGGIGFEGGYFDKMSEDEIKFQFACIIKDEVQDQYPNFDNIVLVDEERGEHFVVRGKYIDLNVKDKEETSRFRLMEL